jgi:hypothetical protein
VPKDTHGNMAIHYTTVYKVFARWSDDGSLDDAFIASVGHLSDHNHLDLRVLHGDGTNTVAKKGGNGLGYSGYKHQKGEKVIAIIDNNGYVLAPLPVAPVHEADTVLLPEGLKGLKRLAKRTGLVLEGSYLNLDGGFDSTSNRKAIFTDFSASPLRPSQQRASASDFAKVLETTYTLGHGLLDAQRTRHHRRYPWLPCHARNDESTKPHSAASRSPANGSNASRRAHSATCRPWNRR